MAKQHIQITQVFNTDVNTLFNIVTDHETFGQIINTKIKRVVDSQDNNKNGNGSIRQISAFPFPAFEETVITFKPDQLMEYVISKGSPIKNHKGRMEFYDEQGKTRINYTIVFEPRLPFIFLGSLFKTAIWKPIEQGLKKLADKYDI